MFASAIDSFSMLSNTVHGTAFILGATVYLGYSLFPTIYQLFQQLVRSFSITRATAKSVEPDTSSASEGAPNDQPKSAESQWASPPRQPTRRDLAAAIALLCLLIGVALSAHGSFVQPNKATCPADLDARLDALQPAPTAATPGNVQEVSAARVVPPEQADDSEVQKLRAKFGGRGAWKFVRPAAAEKLSEAVAETERKGAHSEVLAQASAFQQSCKTVTEELQRQSGRVKGSPEAPPRTPATLLASLWALKKLEEPFRETLSALNTAAKVVEASEQQDELQNALGATRSSALQALQQGRSVALALPKNAALVKMVLQCRPRMLEDFHALVMSEVTQAKDAATMFALGLFYSDVGLAVEQGQSEVPLFGQGFQAAKSWNSEPIWAADAGGSHAPSDIVQAETLLLAGEEASVGADQSDRAAARALRLYQHAKMLALKHHDGAAEWRYRAAAELAAANRRNALAAHALGRLGYFLSLRGHKEEGLEASAKALVHNPEDALAMYLQASLKRSLGELQTTEQVLVAEKQLGLVAGKLPSKTLEAERAAAHAELGWWRLVASEGLQVCFSAYDAAQTFICLMAGLIFDLPGKLEVAQ